MRIFRFILILFFIYCIGVFINSPTDAQEKEEIEVEGGKLYNFDTDKVSAMPNGWSAYVTGRGPNSLWEVQGRTDAPVVDGNRRQLKSANIPLVSGKWYLMRIENKGNRIVCFLDDKKYLDVEDVTFKAGKIGLWTKADAVTAFDNLRVKKEKEEE